MNDCEQQAQVRQRKSDNAKRVFGLSLAGALALYILSYGVIEHWRNRQGPWQVTFGMSTNQAWISINQHRLGVTNVQISFAPPLPSSAKRAAETESMPPKGGHAHETIIFDTARAVPFDLPFGRCVFLDTTVLPGTVTIQLYGHEIELLPRTLIIDRREHQWQPGGEIELPRISETNAAKASSPKN